jgi:hypothetical protein
MFSAIFGFASSLLTPSPYNYTVPEDHTPETQEAHREDDAAAQSAEVRFIASFHVVVVCIELIIKTGSSANETRPLGSRGRATRHYPISCGNK